MRTLKEPAGTFSLIEVAEMQLDHTMQVVERLVEAAMAERAPATRGRALRAKRVEAAKKTVGRTVVADGISMIDVFWRAGGED